MDCKEIKGLLYEFFVGEIDENSRIEVEGHIKECKQCNLDVEKMRDILELLKKAEPPPPSSDFRERLLMRVREIPLPPKPFLQRLAERIQIPRIKWALEPLYIKRSLKWATVAAGILLTLTITRSFITEKPHEEEKLQRGFQITLSEVKSPIIIESGNVDVTLARLKEIIQSHNGKVVQVLQADKGLKITFNVGKKEEGTLLSELPQLGKVQIEKEGFKDRDGNILVLLKER